MLCALCDRNTNRIKCIHIIVANSIFQICFPEAFLEILSQVDWEHLHTEATLCKHEQVECAVNMKKREEGGKKAFYNCN